jgi:hypothetical protein
MKRLRDDAFQIVANPSSTAASSMQQQTKTMRKHESDTAHHACSDDAYLAAKTDDAHLGSQTKDLLVENVLSMLLSDVERITAMAHRETHEPRSYVRQASGQRASFSQSLGTLKRSYICLLETTLESSWCSDRAASVRSFADAIKQKLRDFCPTEAEDGIKAMEQMLEEYLAEWQLRKVAMILQSALEVASEKQKAAYAEAKATEASLVALRHRAL